MDVAAYESCEEYAGNSAAPALIGWDIADLYPARMALIRALCEGIASSITMGTQILADGQVQVDHKDGDLLALHVNAISTVGGVVRALIIEQDRVPSGVSTGTTTGASERADLQKLPLAVQVLMEHLPAAPLAATRTTPKRRPYLPGQMRISSPRH